MLFYFHENVSSIRTGICLIHSGVPCEYYRCFINYFLMNTLFFYFYGKDVLDLDLKESWEPCENAKTVSRALHTV